MGGLISKPKAPKPLPPPPAPEPEPIVSETDPEQEQREQRRQNLLRRNRGLFGTVRTSLRGINAGALSDTVSANATNTTRKNLLGE